MKNLLLAIILICSIAGFTGCASTNSNTYSEPSPAAVPPYDNGVTHSHVLSGYEV